MTRGTQRKASRIVATNSAGKSLSAAYVIGYFDSIGQMNAVYDQYVGASGIECKCRDNGCMTQMFQF